jgi:hypothetical protein
MNNVKLSFIIEISGYHGGKSPECGLLSCDIIQVRRYLQKYSLKIKAICSSTTLVTTYRIARCHNPGKPQLGTISN